jgi:hypothetical protein
MASAEVEEELPQLATERFRQSSREMKGSHAHDDHIGSRR